jgi:hypothetical protein
MPDTTLEEIHARQFHAGTVGVVTFHNATPFGDRNVRVCEWHQVLMGVDDEAVLIEGAADQCEIVETGVTVSD